MAAGCPRGQQPSATGCVPVDIPQNAELDVYGHGWTCKRGFRRVGPRCVPVEIPQNAELDVYGHGWKCKHGYKAVGEKCVPMTPNELHAYERAQRELLLRVHSRPRLPRSTDCEGYNSETESYVYGECEHGDFEGYDSETGSYVYGDCEPGGDLEAYDSETGNYVSGECD